MPIIIAFEGIDSCGKTTQINRLAEYLTCRGQLVTVRSYPAYMGFFGREIGKYLTGELGISSLDVDPKSMAMWYAADRFHDFDLNRDQLQSSDYILLNRWTMSNQAFQGARSALPQEIIEWVDVLEHQMFGLPRPDVYLVLDSDPEKSAKLTEQKGDRGYTAKADVHEANMDLQRRALDLYRYFAHLRRDTSLISFGEVDNVTVGVMNSLMNRGLILE